MITHSSPQSGIASFKNFVATAGYDNQVILWDANKKKAIARATHDHLVNQISFSNCGQLLITSSSDYSARLWSIPDLRLKAILNEHNDDVEGVAIHNKKNLIVTTSRDKQVHLYDFQGNIQKRLEGHTKDVLSVAWLDDSDRLVTSSDDGTIKIWNATTGNIEKDINLEGVETDTIAITSSGIIYAGNDNGEIVVIDDKVKNKISAHDAGIKRLVYDEQQNALVSLSYDRHLCIWTCKNEGKLTLINKSVLPNIIWPRSCTFLDEDSIAFVTFGDTYAMYTISSNQWKISHVKPTNGINAISYRNNAIFSVGDSGIVKKDKEIICELGSLCNFISNVGDFLVAGGQSGEVFDAETGEVYYHHFSPLNCVTKFYKGNQAYAMVGTYTGEGILFKVTDHGLEFERVYTLHENAIKGLSASNNLMFSVCADSTVTFFDIQSLKIVNVIQQAHNKIINGCCSDNNGRFFSVSRDQKLKIWQDQKATIVNTPSQHSIKCVAVTEDARHVTIGTYSGHIGVYDTAENSWVYWSRRTRAGISSIININKNSFIASAYDGEIYSIYHNSQTNEWSEVISE